MGKYLLYKNKQQSGGLQQAGQLDIYILHILRENTYILKGHMQ
jgi:hypothetical protein